MKNLKLVLPLFILSFLVGCTAPSTFRPLGKGNIRGGITASSMAIVDGNNTDAFLFDPHFELSAGITDGIDIGGSLYLFPLTADILAFDLHASFYPEFIRLGNYRAAIRPGFVGMGTNVFTESSDDRGDSHLSHIQYLPTMTVAFASDQSEKYSHFIGVESWFTPLVGREIEGFNLSTFSPFTGITFYRKSGAHITLACKFNRLTGPEWDIESGVIQPYVSLGWFIRRTK